jgi:2-keto-3-deoxy-L-rhamnonate aldolase RhmA
MKGIIADGRSAFDSRAELNSSLLSAPSSTAISSDKESHMERLPLVQASPSYPLFGLFSNTGSPVNAEICASIGFDWILVDLEHGAGSEAHLLPTLWAIRSAGCRAVVRVESSEHSRMTRVLDLGADGIMVPCVESAEEAQSIVTSAWWPPHGRRGISLQSRAGGYGSVSHHDVEGQAKEPFIIAQIESPAGVENVEAIAAMPGISCIFLGPTDLSHSLRSPGNFQTMQFETATRRIVTAALANNIVLGVLAADQQSATDWHSQGFGLIAIGSDGSYLRKAASATLLPLLTAREAALASPRV